MTHSEDSIRLESREVSLSELAISKGVIQKDIFPTMHLFAEYVLLLSTWQPDNPLYDTVITVCSQILRCSKERHFTQINASSNAFTVLNFLNHSFSGEDLSQIKVRGSYLESGIFNCTDLHEAELVDCTMSKTILNSCNLSNANLRSVNLDLPSPNLTGHTGSITSLQISKDMQFLISGSKDSTIRIWDFPLKIHVDTLGGHIGSVNSIAIAPDQKHVVSGGSDKTVRVWDFRLRKEVGVLNGHTDEVLAVKVSSDNRYIVSGGKDKTVIIWNFANRVCEKILCGHTDDVAGIALSHQQEFFVVSCSHDCTIRVHYDVFSGKESKCLKEHTNQVYAVAVTDNDQ